MLFRPAIIALLLASAANFAMLLAVAPFAVAVLRHWDISSGSQRQLTLERRTYLVSTLLSLILATQLLALLLFVFNADRMAALIVGAMCAVGTLNANAYGFPALTAQIVAFFLSAIWLAIHLIDIQAPDYPLIRVKYALLLAITPVFSAVFFLELRYFLLIKADIITSCCSRLFSSASQGLSGDLASLPPLPAMLVCFGALLLALIAAGCTARRGHGGSLLALASAAAFLAGIAGILSFLSLYIYEHPHHHCPFCVLKQEFGYVGYLLYVPLFAATAAGLASGAVQLFTNRPTLRHIVPRSSRRLATLALLGFALFTVLAALIIFRSNLILIEPKPELFSQAGKSLHPFHQIQGVQP